MKYPYIYTSDQTLVNQAADFDNEQGVCYRAINGVHAIWAARVPFLPAMLSDDLIRMGNDRIGLVQARQFRFIYDLSRLRENLSTISLRFISTLNPNKGQPNLIDIVYFGKVFARTAQQAQVLSERLWEKFYSLFPMEEPFGYPLEPVTEAEEFNLYFEPFSFQTLDKSGFLEIRKYEEMPIQRSGGIGHVAKMGDYITHPFVPNPTSNPMSRFLLSLANQPEKCLVDISLRPTKMFDQEIYNTSFMIGQFKKSVKRDEGVSEEYIQNRAMIGTYVYQNLIVEREQLQMVRVHLVGESEAPKGLAEALGSELMGNAANKYPTNWVAAQPADDHQFQIALNNLQYLEHDFWGHTLAAPPLTRLRYLCTASEAYGAFRLPIPPESGYVPGTLVRNEPFISPVDELEFREQARANRNDVLSMSKEASEAPKITLGRIYHRGTETVEDFTVPVSDLTRHALIAGSTGSGKSTTIKHLLSQLWIEHKAPFMVLYPVDKPDYRELLGFDGLVDDLLIFTVGDESTSPFRFNPFQVQKNVLIKTHISRMMRIFESAFSLQEPLPMIYREALRKVYRDKGWNVAIDRGGDQHEYPIMSEFFEAIKQITDNLKYGREVGDNIRQASVIRIGDLLENVGMALNVRESIPFDLVLNRPTIMELGRIGSTDDIALMMGFLLISFAEALEVSPKPKTQPHITVVEEAHRLMSESSGGDQSNTRGNAGEDFGNLLAEVRAFGEGIIIAEQIPTILVKGAIGNTYLKIMHWLEDAPSFELFSNITNLDQNQRTYARTLKPGFAIVRSMYGQPVHLKVPEFGDQPGFTKENAKDISDARIRSRMNAKLSSIGLQDIQPVRWCSPFDAKGEDHGSSQTNDEHAKHMQWISVMPMRTCLYCPGRFDFKCRYKTTIEKNFLSHADYREAITKQSEQLLSAKNNAELFLKTNQLKKWLIDESKLNKKEAHGLLYCALAHEADNIRKLPETNISINKRFIRLLQLLEEKE